MSALPESLTYISKGSGQIFMINVNQSTNQNEAVNIKKRKIIVAKISINYWPSWTLSSQFSKIGCFLESGYLKSLILQPQQIATKAVTDVQNRCTRRER